MKIEDLTIGEAKQLAQMFSGGCNSNQAPQYNGEMVMVTLHRGWIFVGRLYSEGDYCVLKDAVNCRSHSTGKGWGYVASQGKESCKTDDYSDSPIKFHRNQVLFTQEVEESKWT